MLCLVSQLAFAEPIALPSGIRVGLEPVPGQGVVALELRLDVGAAEDPPGRSGLAHLAEHAALLGDPDIPEAEVEGVTSHDATRFLVRLPVESLDPALVWVKGMLRPMAPPVEAAYQAERRVVAAEAGRDGALEPALRGRALFPPAHPYHLPASGTREDVLAIGLDLVVDFQRRWYRPDLAALALTGELPEDAAERVRAVLGDLERRPDPPPERRALPGHLSAWPHRWHAPGAEPRWLALWPAPPVGHDDEDALRLLAAALELRLAAAKVRAVVASLPRRLAGEWVARVLPGPPRLLEGPAAPARRAAAATARAMRGLGALSEDEIAAARARVTAREGQSVRAVAERVSACLIRACEAVPAAPDPSRAAATWLRPEARVELVMSPDARHAGRGARPLPEP